MHHGSELLVPGFGHPILCRGKMPWACGMAAYIRDGYRDGSQQSPVEISGLLAQPIYVVEHLTS